MSAWYLFSHLFSSRFMSFTIDYHLTVRLTWTELFPEIGNILKFTLGLTMVVGV